MEAAKRTELRKNPLQPLTDAQSRCQPAKKNLTVENTLGGLENGKNRDEARTNSRGPGSPLLVCSRDAVQNTARGGPLARDGPATYGIYYSDKWKFFPDFLRDYVPEVFGIEWCKAEAPKPEAERHPVIRWRAQGAAYMNAQPAQPDGSRAPECHLGGTGPDDIRLPALAPSLFVRGLCCLVVLGKLF
jgi:hypothetical protein